MLAQRLGTLAIEWDSALASLGVELGSASVVVGANAELVGESLLLATTPPLVASTGEVALLGKSLLETDLVDAAPDSLPLANGSVDSAVAIHAWEGRRNLPAVLAETVRVVRSGGFVVLAELDYVLLAGSTPRQYPSALIHMTEPDAFALTVARCVDRYALEIEALRNGLTDVASHQADVTIGRYPDARSHGAAVRGGLWRGSSEMTSDQLDNLALATERLGSRGEIVDKEPWVLVRGVPRS